MSLASAQRIFSLDWMNRYSIYRVNSSLRARASISYHFLAPLFSYQMKARSAEHGTGATLKDGNEDIRKQEQAKNVGAEYCIRTVTYGLHIQ